MTAITEHDGQLRAILYTAQFEDYLTNGAERIARLIASGGIPGLTVPAAVIAMETALASDRDLAGLMPIDHNDASIREFFSLVTDGLGS